MPLLSDPLNLSLLPKTPLYGAAEDPGFGWKISPSPFVLSQHQYHELIALGECLLQFMRAIDLLVRQSANGVDGVPPWVAELYRKGKPEGMVQYAGMNRFKSQLPMVLRPDLLMRDDGWTLCEIDAVPGGLGFTSALNQVYYANGFSVIEPQDTLPQAFLRMLQTLTPKLENPTIAVIVSDEAGDYRPELAWLVQAIQQGNPERGVMPYPNIVCIHPSEVGIEGNRLIYRKDAAMPATPIDIVYRFFELFDLPNIPNAELIQFAIKKGWVKCTPPFKPHLEEKLSLALLFHPALAAFWQKNLGTKNLEYLKTLVPKSWVLDPAPLPPQAVIAGLTPGGKAVQSFDELKPLSQKNRQLVLKTSGFSPIGWGSKSVTVGHDESSVVWGERIDAALASFETNPYILQEYNPSGVRTLQQLDVQTGTSHSFPARTRLCPYYLVTNGRIELASILATSCPADKKIIHGMKDAILAPCIVDDHA
ncbi:MAG: hypothetical protein AAGI66_05680 [Cyanobacteria bacterium P01_H01_bin.74]